MVTKIIVAGPRGKMGSEALNMIQKQSQFKLVACLDHKNNGKNIKDLDELPNIDAPIYNDPDHCFKQVNADVFIDLTTPEVGFKHTLLALENNIRPVVGTSGFTDEQLEELSKLAKEKQLGCIIAPNFAIGAILMMKFAKMAAAYFPDVEIIEKHHDQKLDAPSGTAVKTAAMIKEVRKSKEQGHPDERETLTGARGASVDGIHIHSLRLPGLVAHQEIMFGGPGQTLTINHDSLNRASFMDGIRFSVEQVLTLNHLVYGLENLIK